VVLQSGELDTIVDTIGGVVVVIVPPVLGQYTNG